MAQQNTDGGFIHVPSMNLYVAKQKTLQGNNWFEAQKELQKKGLRMLTIPEFLVFFKYAKSNFPDVYSKISAEWFDAYFEQRKDGMYVLTGNRTKAEKLDKITLMEDKQIDLESWLSHPTRQGLPRQNVKKGDLDYYFPRDNSVAWFDVSIFGSYVGCGRDSRSRFSVLEVRAVKQ